jgi:hypothetical protein
MIEGKGWSGLYWRWGGFSKEIFRYLDICRGRIIFKE